MPTRFAALCLALIFQLSTAWAQQPAEPEPTPTASERIDAAFAPVVNGLAVVLFWDPFEAFGLRDPTVRDAAGNAVLDQAGDPIKKNIPIVVIWLVVGAVIFTIKMRFVNIRGFSHALALVRGKYDNPKDAGEVTHFQALATALSGTVGLGNIAGVAVAITIGGAGATFWLIVAGLLGMSSKFVECTLGVKYRHIDDRGRVSGGPMYYLKYALAKRGRWQGQLGNVLAVVFAILCVGGSFGGGNMFQANQALVQVKAKFPALEHVNLLGIDGNVWFGIGMAALVGLVIVGGIRSIARVTDKMVPIMVGVYVLFSLIIIGINVQEIGYAISEILSGAFSPDALKGGIVGVLIVGFQRAAFSNEAGVGSASIAHSASKTEHPISEGLVSLLEPFIDTVVVCTMTALVLIFTGFHNEPSSITGTTLTSMAFSSVFSWFDWVLLFTIFLFAFSTMISWSYYGIKAWTFLFGPSRAAIISYKLIFLGVIVLGSASSLNNVIAFSDMMILGMAFPNILGIYFLVNEVKDDLEAYFVKLKQGVIKPYKSI